MPSLVAFLDSGNTLCYKDLVAREIPPLREEKNP